MKFMLMMHAPATAPAGTGILNWQPAEIQAHIGHMRQLNKELRATGELVAAEGLDFPARPRSVRANGGGAPLVTDGPFVETKEALGGFYIVEAADLDQAMTFARQCPAPYGGIEVRPIMDTSQPPAGA